MAVSKRWSMTLWRCSNLIWASEGSLSDLPKECPSLEVEGNSWKDCLAMVRLFPHLQRTALRGAERILSFFLRRLPRVRPMLGGLPKDVADKGLYLTSLSWTNTTDRAMELLCLLVNYRKDDPHHSQRSQFRRPLFFICHSIGGRILKKV